jgi:hypothetical protein
MVSEKHYGVHDRTWKWITFVAAALLLAACGRTDPTSMPPTPTETEMPSTPRAVPTTAPSNTPVAPTQTSTAAPTQIPSALPTLAPTETPTVVPAITPTSSPVKTEEAKEPEPTPAGLAGLNLVFARFEEAPVDTSVPVPQEPIAPDLSNVRIPFALSAAQLDRLARDGFVVSPGEEKEFFTVYEKARYANVPLFVTSDSLLHIYHLLFDKVLRTAETEHLVPLLRDLNRGLLARAEEVYDLISQTGDVEWINAARRTVAFVSVASKLLDPDVQVPDYASELVASELALIEAAAGIEPSPLFPELENGEDYTQYIPRGHYTRSEVLQAYFRSMMWYGRMTFLLAPDDPDLGRPATRAALLLVHTLRTSVARGEPALAAWADLYNPTVFFVGRSDDLTALQYIPVIDAVYGPDVTLADMVEGGDAVLDAFIAQANKLPPPRILGMVIMDTDDVEAATKGLRFMGQRFVPDAYIFRQLIYRNVSTIDNRRGLPKGLDLLAAMGSDRAYQLLDEMGETAYANYPEQMAKVKDWVSGLSVEQWTETLYNSWLFAFLPLLEVPDEGPAFAQSAAWVDKQLNTVLGSWTELKHDTILYAKQVYAELGGGPMPPAPVPPKGFVEPVPQFFARLAALTQMTREGLGTRGLLVEQDDLSLQRLEELASSFKNIAEKELRSDPLTQEEYRIITYYGGELEHLTMAAADRPEDQAPGAGFMEEEPQAAVIADVATDPYPQVIVLEEAVGRIDSIYVVTPIVNEDGTAYLQVSKGGVFSYYEFPWPGDDRLTDEKWRDMLDASEAPAPPDWTASFTVRESESSEFTAAILRFQKSLIGAYFFLEPDGVEAQGFEGLPGELEALRGQGHFAERLLESTDLRSVDRQSEERTIVTVREMWADSLYPFVAYPGDRESDDPVAQRGPYTLDVTYTLEKGEQGWQVTRAVYANQPPEWSQ